jgi:choice-of-anchor A domain-containing protein
VIGLSGNDRVSLRRTVCAGRLLALAGALAAIVATAPRASAATFAATELTYDNALLSQFNLLNLQSFTASGNETIGGRALVGGNFTTNGTETICNATACSGNTTLPVTATPGAAFTAVAANTASNNTGSGYGYGSLTVFGNIVNSGTATNTVVKLTDGGDLDVKGNVGSGKFSLPATGTGSGANVAGTVQSNTVFQTPTELRVASTTGLAAANYTSRTGQTVQTSDTLAQIFEPFVSSTDEADEFKTPLQDLYAGLANLPGTPGVAADALPSGQTGIFTSGSDYTANGKTYGVVTTTIANFAAEGASFTGVANKSTDAATIVVISGDGAGLTLPTITNTDPKVIYDFVGASTLKLGGAFDGTILAPLATLTEGTGTVNGTVVVASMTQTQALVDTNAFTGDLSGLAGLGYNARVPEPWSVALLAAGIAAGIALGACVQRRTVPA